MILAGCDRHPTPPGQPTSGGTAAQGNPPEVPSSRTEGRLGAQVQAVKFSPDGKLLAVAFAYRGRESRSPDLRPLKVFDVAEGKEVAALADTTLQHPDGGPGKGWTTFAFLPDSRRVLARDADGLKVVDLLSGAEERPLKTFRGVIDAVAVSPDGKQALTGGRDGNLRLYDLSSGELVYARDTWQAGIADIAFAPDGKRAYLTCRPSGQGGEVDSAVLKIWDVPRGEVIRAFEKGWDGYFAFTQDGKLAVTEHSDNPFTEKPHLVLVDVTTGMVVRQFAAKEGGLTRASTLGTAFSLAFSLDGTQVFSADSDKLLRAWDVATGRALWSQPLVPGSSVPAFSADRRLAVAVFLEVNRFSDGMGLRLTFWDLTKGEVLKEVTLKTKA